MATTGAYPDPDTAQMGGASAGLYVNQNGNGSPPQQQQHVPTDPDLQLREDLSQHLQRTEMMLPGGAQGHQMNPPMNAQHHPLQTPSRPTHSPQQMAQSVMSLEEHSAYGEHDGGSSRKRSKVSRACDECRRKKIRCDATSENGPEACSSCKRTGARCQFSRQPMKRGPSKGYIKELADRLNTLETQISSPHAPPQTGYDYMGIGEQNLSGLPDLGAPQFHRKRTHSMSEGLQDQYQAPHRPGMGWPGQEAHRADMAPNGGTPVPYRRQSYGDVALAGSLLQGSNEGVIKAYYAHIHPILPILPQDHGALNRITNCPAKLREAFFLALECGVRSFAPVGLPPTDAPYGQLMLPTMEATDHAQHLLNDTDSSTQFFNQLVYCQALTFLAFASDKAGPNGMGRSAEYLGRVAARISDLGLNDSKVLDGLRDQDIEAYQAARRLFWVVFILDRFHAQSRSKDILLPLYCGSVSRDDSMALGEAGYHLARAADIVGQIAYIVRAGSIPNLEPSSPYAFTAMTATSPSSLFLNGQLARYYESLEMSGFLGNTTPYLAYQFLRIIVASLSQYTAPSEIFSLARELLNNLMQGPPTPLSNIFASLVATSLTEVADRVETSLEAHAAMKEMDDAIANGHIVPRSPEGLGWDVAIREILHRKASNLTTSAAEPPAETQANMAGLQHLAAAAVGEREGADATTRPTSSGGNGMNAANTAAPVPDVKLDVAAAVAAASEAAAAQATAAAAQKQLQNDARSGSGPDLSTYDPSTLIKDGFMSSLTQG